MIEISEAEYDEMRRLEILVRDTCRGLRAGILREIGDLLPYFEHQLTRIEETRENNIGV